MKSELSQRIDDCVNHTNAAVAKLFDGLSNDRPLAPKARLAKSILLATRLEFLCDDLAFDFPQFETVLRECQDSAEKIEQKLQSVKADLDAQDSVCECRQCDDCVAARSDEHYDRSRDGRM
jgi:hypothetical protein